MSSIIKETKLGSIMTSRKRVLVVVVRVEWDDGAVKYESRENGCMSRRDDLSSLLEQVARRICYGWYGKQYKITTLRLAKDNNLFNDIYVIERAIARLLNDNKNLIHRLVDERGDRR